MLTDSFDPRTPAKINPAPSPDALPVDACILTFSRKIADYVLAAYPCRQIGWSRSACGDTPIYCLDRAGKRFAFFLSYIGAPACTAMIEETRAVFRTEKYVLFGGAGCLDKEIARGKVMVPTAAYRDEGTSYHYAPAADYIDLPGARAVAAFCAASTTAGAASRAAATIRSLMPSTSLLIVSPLSCWTRRLRRCRPRPRAASSIASCRIPAR